MSRQPLPEGHVIEMLNGAVYTIKRLIGEGGFSLIYSADTVGGTTPVVIKEFFPSEGAFRNKDGIVLPEVGKEESFQRHLTRFENRLRRNGTRKRGYAFSFRYGRTMGKGCAFSDYRQ